MPADPWLPAPTCAGWWWFRGGPGMDAWVYRVVARDGQLSAQDVVVAHIATHYPLGRWSGPLTPPGDEG